MKRIIIGRGSDCDIIIQDPTETVSRHHLVISMNFFGKMTISDTSSNGTWVNGRRISKGVPLPVSRHDAVRLGDVADLDWNRIQDPYAATRKIAMIGSIVVALLAIGFGVWWFMGEKNGEKEQIEITAEEEGETSDELNKESTENVAPVENSTATGEKPVSKKKNSAKAASRKKTTPKRVNSPKGGSDKSKEVANPPKNRINEADRKVMPKNPEPIRKRDHSQDKDND